MDTQIQSDGELLAAFAGTRDEAPFEALIERHGAMVLNACERILRQRADAEDAAQAVFMALAAKCRDGDLQRRASIGGWLYQAAWHVSLRARDAAKRRRKRNEELSAMRDSAAEAAAAWRELSPVLDGELQVLPEKYRAAIVLHHLEERPIEEAAQAMGCSADAAKQRLSRGREMLRAQLARRGVVLSAGLIASAMSAHAAGSPLPAAFAAATSKSALSFALNGGAAATRSAELAREALNEWNVVKIRYPRIAVAVLLIVAIGVGSVWSGVAPAPGPGTVSRPTPPKRTPSPLPPEDPKKRAERMPSEKELMLEAMKRKAEAEEWAELDEKKKKAWAEINEREIEAEKIPVTKSGKGSRGEPAASAKSKDF